MICITLSDTDRSCGNAWEMEQHACRDLLAHNRAKNPYTVFSVASLGITSEICPLVCCIFVQTFDWALGKEQAATLSPSCRRKYYLNASADFQSYATVPSYFPDRAASPSLLSEGKGSHNTSSTFHHQSEARLRRLID